jgi:two-component system, cell cycle sensor histidine kinase and response regulator CckA
MMNSSEKTILVVDDHQETLYMLSRALAVGGFTVLWARDGADALMMLERHQGDVDMMLVDVVLPGMSGPELVEQATRLQPGIRAIYVSAFDEATVREHGVDPGVVPFLAKPYEPEDLVDRVNEVLLA